MATLKDLDWAMQLLDHRRAVRLASAYKKSGLADSTVIAFSIHGHRVPVQFMSPRDIDELPLLFCHSCDLAYLVKSEKQDAQPSIAEWNRRVKSISEAILLEHDGGHPSTQFIHDGMLRGYRRG